MQFLCIQSIKLKSFRGLQRQHSDNKKIVFDIEKIINKNTRKEQLHTVLYTMQRNSLRNGSNRGTTESDAAHIRFLEQGPIKTYRCSSCRRPFDASNKAEIMEHFENIVHNRSTDCLYCQGAVYHYINEKGEIQSYHNCLPCKKQRKKS